MAAHISQMAEANLIKFAVHTLCGEQLQCKMVCFGEGTMDMQE